MSFWEFENEQNAPYIGSHDSWTIIYDLKMTHGDQKLDLEYEDDEKRRAQNKTSSERVEEYAFVSCSLELNSPV
jgi:hypothetical protein